MRAVDRREIAVIGMAVNFPMAENIKEYWENLKSGKDCIREFPEHRRRDIEGYAKFLGKEPEYIQAGFLEHIDLFDNRFFRISPMEAMLMSPAQRLFLEVAYGAFYDAGYEKEKLDGSKTGVYAGYIGDFEGHLYRDMLENLTSLFSTVGVSGNLSSVIAGRVSYSLNLTGPSMVIDTACSSSLVALHTACRDIRDGICDMALAGGVKLCMLPTQSDEKIGIESSDGRTRTFDERADGTGIGEGCAAVVLKPLRKAERDGDYIYGVIKGGFINQDGASSAMTAPNPSAQRDLYLEAWRDAGIHPEDISYIETHGTGTKLGDPIEIEGLTKAFRKFTQRTQFCGAGSVKSNIGHLYEAAGIASFIKTILALNMKEIPQNIHFEMPNPQIDFIHSPFYVVGESTKWESEGKKRLAGVSAFGFSGTNCHMIVEEYDGRAKPYMESMEERLEKSRKKLFDRKRFWFEIEKTDIAGRSEQKNFRREENRKVRLTGRESFSQTEQKIADLWGRHMGYESLDISDNFFRLGGDSIIAAKIISGIQKEIKGDIKNSDIFRYPTIHTLAEYLDSASRADRQKIEKLPDRPFYQASAEQQRLYIVYRMDEVDLRYNMPFVAEFKIKIERAKIEKSIRRIIERHESLRTSFFEKEGIIYQRIEELGDWRADFERIREEELQEKLQSCRRPFDLAKAPLVRAKIFETEFRTILFLDMHHIISDGTSMGIFVREFMDDFEGRPLTPLEIQYKDFSDWQSKYLKTEEVKRQEEFWKGIFADRVPLLRLPQDHEHPPVRTARGGSLFFSESGKIREAVEERAKKHRCTPFVILMSAYYLMLYKMTKQKEMVVGSPVSGRTHYQALPLIGMFVNIIPIRVHIDSEKSLFHFIESVKEEIYRAYENQECPFERITELCAQNRVEGRSPLTDVIFAYQNQDMPRLILEGEEARTYSTNFESKYDLLLEIYDNDSGYDLRFEYYREIFREERIEEFSRIYRRMLQGMLETEDMTVRELIDEDRGTTEKIIIDFAF